MPIINAISNGSLRSFGVLINRQRPINLSVVASVEVLVVGGGGGGGGSPNSGGGGAGGYSSSPAMSVTPSTRYTVRVGAGGGTNSNGTNSGIFVTSSGATLITWARGGGRGAPGNNPGVGGFSGPSSNPDGFGSGGGGGNRPLGGVPPAGPGNTTSGGGGGNNGNGGGRGGITPTNTGPVGAYGEPQFGGGGGGGGGASQGGGDGGDTVTPYIYGGSWPFANNAPASITYENAWGGNGGNGISSTISGSTFYYCGGGAGGGETPNNTNRRAVGGFGGGGGGNSPGSPVGRRQYANPNGVLTGGHPGSGDSYTGGGGSGGSGGGSGVVIIRYPISFARANATFISGQPIYSEDATYRYYTFQGSGSIGFTPGTSVDP